MDALTKYYQAKEREESAVLYINNSFLETMSSLEKLEAEYEHMRLKDMAIIGGLEKENERLKVENAKLLELVEDMLDCIQIRAAFSRPPTDEMYEMFYKRARELGVDE